MIAVGNHEHTPGTMTNSSGTFNVDYAAFQTRYAAVPSNGNSNLWYSYVIPSPFIVPYDCTL
jgi:hypothetical protein